MRADVTFVLSMVGDMIENKFLLWRESVGKCVYEASALLLATPIFVGCVPTLEHLHIADATSTSTIIVGR